MEGKVLGFIGGGNMAYAIAKGIVDSGLVPSNKIHVSARTETRLRTVWKDLGCMTTTDNCHVVSQANVIFLAVKPHILPKVLREIACEEGTREKLFISVAAGVTLHTMETYLRESAIIRTMPNTPCLVQCGMVVYACNRNCTERDKDVLRRLLQVTGEIEEVDESQIDAMSALMGCSVAWYQLVLEGMADGGVMNGVGRVQAYKLVAKSMEGAARMLLQTGKCPGQLKDEVTSPGGSTICGINVLEEAGTRGAFMRAVTSATERNKQLGQNK